MDAFEPGAVGVVETEHLAGIFAGINQPQRFVGVHEHAEGVFLRGGVGEFFQRGLRAVDGGDIGVARKIIAGDQRFMPPQRVDEVLQTLARIGGVAAVGKTGDEGFEGFKGFARAFGVALGQIDVRQPPEQAEVGIEGGQPFEVVGVIDVGVIGMQADETLGGGNGFFRLGGFVVGVGGFKLRLLRVATVRVAGFEAFKVFDGFLEIAFVQRFLAGVVDFLRRPADGVAASWMLI